MNEGMRTLRAMDRWALVRYMVMVGALAGLLSWLVMYGAHFLFDIEKPSLLSLVLAIPRGALYGVILALILRAYWNRRSAS